MDRRRAVIIGRLVMAALSLAGVVTQFVVAVQTDFGLVNFFSYFTNLANLFGSAVFVIGAVRLVRGHETTDLDVALRGASVVYLAFVGLVFNTLLVGVELGGLKPWVNVVHHMLMPLAVLVDWLVWPPRSRTSVRTMLWWMVFPAVYAVYSVVRGGAMGFYPYPFFSPEKVGGYAGVIAYCVAMLVGFVVLALLVRWIGNRRSTSWADDGERSTPAPGV